jgi:predicted N-formylglutamate amidohydrolase
VLYNRDARLAGELLRRLRAESGLVIGDNEPYAVGDTTDYTIPEHGERRGLAHVGIELRQDLISAEGGQIEWTERLARALVSIVVPV